MSERTREEEKGIKSDALEVEKEPRRERGNIFIKKGAQEMGREKYHGGSLRLH